MIDSKVEEVLFDILVSVEANYSRFFVTENGSRYFPGGWNGPHFALETPVRNSCHWLVTYSILFDITGNNKYKTYAYEIFRWLHDKNPFYQNGFYINRQRQGQDFCNGVIGNAWIIEAFSIFESVFNEHSSKIEIIEKMTFDKRTSLWRRFDPENNNYKIDYTFDHQAWYASSLVIDAELSGCSAYAVQDFLSNIRNIVSFDSGKNVRHICNTKSFKNKIIKLNYLRNKRDVSHNIHVVECGYNIYSIFPFARMKQYGYNSDGAFQDAVDNINFPFFEANIQNKYFFKYNNPVFELPLVLLSFPNETVSSQFHRLLKLNEQFFQDGKFMNVDDNLTLASRVYELALYFYHRKNKKCVV